MTEEDTDPSELEEEIAELHQIAEGINQSQRNLEDHEEDASSTVEEVESDEEQEQAEIDQVEHDRSKEELEKAVEDELSIEKIIEKQEKMVGQEIREIESQISNLHDMISGTENVEEQIISFLEKMQGLLSDAINDIESQLSPQMTDQDYDVVHQNLGKIYEIYNKTINFSDALADFFRLLEEEIPEIKEEAADVYRLEEIIHEIVAEEIGIQEEQVKELEIDAEKLHDKRAYQETEEEKEELKNIIKRVRNEEDEEEKILQKFEQEINESKLIIQEEEKIIEEAEKLRQEIDQAEKFLMKNQETIEIEDASRRKKDEVNINTFWSVIKQGRKATDALLEVEKKGRSIYESSGDRLKSAAELAGRSTKQYLNDKGINFSSPGATTKNATKSIAKIVFYIILAVGIIIAGLFLRSTLFGL